jgi:hypothetical protein
MIGVIQLRNSRPRSFQAFAWRNLPPKSDGAETSWLSGRAAERPLAGRRINGRLWRETIRDLAGRDIARRTAKVFLEPAIQEHPLAIGSRTHPVWRGLVGMSNASAAVAFPSQRAIRQGCKKRLLGQRNGPALAYRICGHGNRWAWRCQSCGDAQSMPRPFDSQIGQIITSRRWANRHRRDERAPGEPAHRAARRIAPKAGP